MRVLLTGGSGFLGKHFLEVYRRELEVMTLGRGDKDDFKRDIKETLPSFSEFFDQVIHCAGKAHSVPKSELEVQSFFEVNYKGTVHLLDALKDKLPKQFVFISTVAVYGKDNGELIDESYPVNGQTPYAESKLLAEKTVKEWGSQHQVKILILRLPLIAGVNPPGNLGKMISGISSGKYLSIARGKAKRSVVLAEDVAMFVKNNPNSEGTYNLTDGLHPTFRDFERVIARQLDKKMPYTISEKLAKTIGRFGDWVPVSPVNSDVISIMINDLTFSDTRARKELNWSPRSVIDHFKIN